MKDTPLFDKSAFKSVSIESESNQIVSDKTLSGMNLHELLALVAKIEVYLPSKSLKDMNLEDELLIQYQQTKALLASIIDDVGTPANQRAQVINSCSSILAQITKTQTDLYNSERLKVLEQALINALKTVPESVSEKFFENYERQLEGLKD